MKLGWYLNRLRSMGPAEILHRLAEQQRKTVSKHRGGGWARYPAVMPRPVFRHWHEALSAATPPQRKAIEAAALAALEGRFSALGRDWPARDPEDLYPAEFWRLDPVSGTPWPGADTYTFAIDYRHSSGRGDVKYVWEANRLQFLPALAAHLALGGGDRAGRAIEAAIASWHAANPPFRGVSWASGIEVALRAASLVVTLDLAGERLGEGSRRQAGQILAASAYWLARFPSAFSSANNHLVAELAGRYLIGLALGRDTDGPRRALLAETVKQILPDGTAAEQSPTYGAFTAEAILLCAAAAEASGAPFPAQTTARLAAFADAAGWLPDGASYGDDDEGRALTLGGEENYVGSVAAAVNGFLGRPGQMPRADDFRSVLFGVPTGPSPRPEGLRTFAEGGLSVWRGRAGGRRVELTFDHGPLGYLSICAHGHADALALALFLDGEPVLVDPGTWLYGSGGAWRDWFRSTPAHNTLNIGGESQSIISGAFNWSHKAAATLAEARPEPDWSLCARHDGYRGRFGAVHERTVAHRPGGIAVIDRLLGKAQEAEIVFQLAPDLAARREGGVVTVARNGRDLLSIRFPDAAIDISTGGAEPRRAGWVSPRFGERLPAPRIAWNGLVGEAGRRFDIDVIAPEPAGGAGGRAREVQD